MKGKPMDAFGAYMASVYYNGATYRVNTKSNRKDDFVYSIPNKGSGFYVALSGFESIVPENDFTFDAFNKYVWDYRGAFQFNDQFLGIWNDGAGLVYLDVTAHVSHESAAIRMAKTHSQLAIWDIANNSSINVADSLYA
jgi:hypothetical protein